MTEGKSRLKVSVLWAEIRHFGLIGRGTRIPKRRARQRIMQAIGRDRQKQGRVTTEELLAWRQGVTPSRRPQAVSVPDSTNFAARVVHHGWTAPGVRPFRGQGKTLCRPLSRWRGQGLLGRSLIVLEPAIRLIQNRGMDQDTLYVGLHLERHDRAKNLHRSYGLQLARSLFGHWGVVRQWGRAGRPGRLKTDWFETASEAEGALDLKLREKQRRGYVMQGGEGRER